jgi:oxepin-CoA hydrolase/3-oxo-5,6-dehydrosuberyl-CoA semialdehyde dehydrogenase
MVEHLEYFIQMAMGKVETDISTPEKYLERTQESLFNYRSMPKAFNHPLLKKAAQENLRFDSLEAAKEALLSSIDAYEVFFKENPGIKTPNTVFGMLDKQLWDLLTRKHFNHHFEQFGLL